MERAELGRLIGGRPGGVAGPNATAMIVEARDETDFRRRFADAVSGSGTVLLAGADWGASERRQLADLVALNTEEPGEAAGRGWLGIPTGGTSGRLRFARHDGGTIEAAVRGFGSHFGVRRVNAVGVLPLHHVSGLMGWLRCALTGGEYRGMDWKEIEAGRLPAVSERPDGWFISLVPTQLSRLLAQPAAVDWLRRFRAVFVGGGPAWPDLLERAAAAQVPVAMSYGMTETAAMVAALTPEEFLAGARSSGRVMPHARVHIGPAGEVAVEGESVFRGYFPEWRRERRHLTADRGRMDERGHLHIGGRADLVIISGGEKVDPEEVEAALREAGGPVDFAVCGVPDEEWGQAVAAAFRAGAAVDVARLRAALVSRLAPAKRPRHFVALEDWPAAGPGKVNRVGLAAAVEAAIRAGRLADRQ